MKKFVLVMLLVLVAAALVRAEAPVNPVRAQLVARNAAVLAAEISAKIRQLHVLEGAAFKAGDVLVSFDDALQQSQVDRAAAVLAAAQKTYASNQRLHRLNSVGQIELDLSEAEVTKAQAEFSYAQAMLAKSRLIAPFCGRVAEQRVHEQEFVQPGQPLLEIIDDAIPQVDFIAPSRWLAWIRVGQKIEVAIDETGRTYPASIERISARVDPVSQSVKIVAKIDEAASDLVAGMSGTISVVAPANP